tara:strand:- start:20053 stop:22584 length:2532 start_codon:yes stop_codon:yes gene_type:complete
MSIKKCIGVIKNAAAEGKIDDAAAMDILEEINDFIDAAGSKNIDNLDAKLQEHIQAKLNDEILAATIEKRNKALSAMAEVRAMRFIDSFDNPFEGIKALLAGSINANYKSKLSIDVSAKSLGNKYIGRIINKLEQNPGDLQLYNSGKIDVDIAKEMWEIKPDGNPGVTKNAAARRIANIIHESQMIAVKNANKAGSFIRPRAGYIMRQSHNIQTIRKAGMDEWVNFIKDKLDESTFKGEDPKKFLESAYKALASGIHRKFQGGETNHLNGFKGPKNLGRRMSQERVLHFKSAEDFMEYNGTFGTGDIREGVVQGLQHLARGTALMKGLGPNPEAMITKLKKMYADKAQKKGDFKITDDFKSRTIDNIMAELDGTTQIPARVTVAKVGAIARAIANVSKLGGATISSVTDIANQAAELRYQGKPLFAAYTNAFANLFRGRGNAEQKQIARALGIGFDGITGDLLSRFHANDHIPGRFAKMQQKFFKLNLMSWWNDSHRTGMALIMANGLGVARNKSFNQLGDRLKNVFKQYGIDEIDWDFYRQYGNRKANGNDYITTDFIDEVDDAAVKEYLTRRGKVKQGPRAISDAKDELMQKLDSFYMDRADHGIPMPGAAERAIMNQGTVAGTFWGEIARMMMQFKSFPITMIRRGLGREIYGQANGKADIMGLAQLMVATTVMGYGAMYAKDVLKGRTPRTIEDWSSPGDIAKILSAAMVQGGGLGIYGDFFFGEGSRIGGGFLSTLAGPTLGQINDLQYIISTIRKGENPTADLLDLAKNNTPFINLFYTRMALDYLFLYQLQESVSPGYLLRTEQRIMRENNQRFLIPPSSKIPYGGGNRLFEGVRD